MKRRRASAPRRGESAAFSQVGIAWYRPEQWARLLEISEDRDDLETTWEEWRREVERLRFA